MRWFHIAAMVTLVLAQLMAIAMTAAIIAMCTDSTHSRSIDGDPAYNGFLIFYLLILVFQTLIIIIAVLGYWIAFKNWQNNYQMDHSQRTRFVIFLALWIVFLLANCGEAIFCIVRGKEREEGMAFLYEKFAKYNQDAGFVAHFERYQREKGCCGIYGPNDWLIVQLRSNTGGGGGGYQSLDYVIMQNPGTGKCHLLPPTVPTGCGWNILGELHVQLNTYAVFMILESIIGMIAGAFMTYCFFYWSEKKVILIPEDDVSNLIGLERGSSTFNAVENAESFGLGIGSGESLGPRGDFPPGGYGSTGSSTSSLRSTEYSMGQTNYGSPSRPPSAGPSQPPFAGSPPPSRSSGKSTRISYSQPGEEQPPRVSTFVTDRVASTPTGPQPFPLRSTGRSTSISYSKPWDEQPPRVSTFITDRVDSNPTGPHPSRSIGKSTRISYFQPWDEQPPRVSTFVTDREASNPTAPSPPGAASGRIQDKASPFRSQHHHKQLGSHASRNKSSRQPTAIRVPTGMGTVIWKRAIASAATSREPEPGKPHSKLHMLHLQEKALGGKLLGEMHVDHKKDSRAELGDAKGGKGKKAHHATVAIVRNRNAPKAKHLLASNPDD